MKFLKDKPKTRTTDELPFKVNDIVRVKLKKSGVKWSSNTYTIEDISRHKYKLSNKATTNKQKKVDEEEKDVVIDKRVQRALKQLDNPETTNHLIIFPV